MQSDAPMCGPEVRSAASAVGPELKLKSVQLQLLPLLLLIARDRRLCISMNSAAPLALAAPIGSRRIGFDPALLSLPADDCITYANGRKPYTRARRQDQLRLLSM